jgi:hypothetical protein
MGEIIKFLTEGTLDWIDSKITVSSLAIRLGEPHEFNIKKKGFSIYKYWNFEFTFLDNNIYSISIDELNMESENIENRLLAELEPLIGIGLVSFTDFMENNNMPYAINASHTFDDQICFSVGRMSLVYFNSVDKVVRAIYVFFQR